MGEWMAYNRDAAVAYALEHAFNYNTEQYPVYPRNDCMNFVSQCIHAGDMAMKPYGYLWYATMAGSCPSWRGVDSFLKYIRYTFGNPRLQIECLAEPFGMLRGDFIFTVADGTPGRITRNPSHCTILSRDVDASGQLFVCGHTIDQRDAKKVRNDRKCTYIHIQGIMYDYVAENYAGVQDMETAELDFGKVILKPATRMSEYVKNVQTRLNYLGFSAGAVDGYYGPKTTKAVKAFQTAYKPIFGLAVDGQVGEATKEAMRYPQSFEKMTESFS